MTRAGKTAVGLLIACVLWAVPAAAQTLIVNDRQVEEHFVLEGTTYVSLEVLLRTTGFDWSVRGGELLLREGRGGGPRLRTVPVAIRLGDASLPTEGVVRQGRVFVPLHRLVPHLGYMAVQDLESDTLVVMAAVTRPARRLRVRRGAGERAPTRIRIPADGRPAADRPAAVQMLAGAVPPPAPAMHAVTLQVEDHPHPDLPTTNWVTTRVVHGPEALRFRWRTHHPDAASGKWMMLVAATMDMLVPSGDAAEEGSGAWWSWTGSPGAKAWAGVGCITKPWACYAIPVEGSPVPAPAPGEEAVFTIDFSEWFPLPQDLVGKLWVDAYPLARRDGEPEPLTTTSPVFLILRNPVGMTIPDDTP